MDPENVDAAAAMGENVATEDLNHAGEGSSPGGSPAEDSETIGSASYWEEVDQEEIERERR